MVIFADVAKHVNPRVDLILVNADPDLRVNIMLGRNMVVDNNIHLFCNNGAHKSVS